MSADGQAIKTAPRERLLTRAWDSDVRRRFTANKLAVGATIWLVVMALASLVGPWLTVDPNFADPVNRLKPPSAEHWFGTDQLGRDIFARVLIGGRISFTVAILATAMSVFIGMVIGTFSGYRGGMVDDFLARIFDILVTFPTLLMGIIIVVAVGPSLTTIIVALALGDMPLYGRLFRAGAISVRNREYIEGAVAIGIPHSRILTRHVLPNIIIPVVVVAAGNMGRVALAEASLSFLGAGVQPPTASWGNMIAAGQTFLQVAWWFPVIPGAVLTLVAISFSFIGDTARDAFDLRGAIKGKAD